MGTKYRKTHNGEPVKTDDDGRVILGSGTTIHPDWLEMGGYIEPVPTVTVELSRETAENYAAGAMRSSRHYYEVVEACKAALRG